MPLVDVTIYERFKEGIFAVSVLAGRQETVNVTDNGEGTAFSCLSQDWWMRHSPLLSHTANIVASGSVSASR